MVTPFLSLPFLAGITPERADSPALLTGTDANAGAFLAEFQKAIMSEAAHDTPEVEVLSPEDSAYDASADTDISFKESAGGIFKNIALKNSQPVQREENNPDVVQSVEQEDCDTLTIATVHIVAPGPDELPTLPAITIREKYYLGNGTFFESFNTESVAIPAETPLRKNTEKSTFKHEKVGKTPALQTEDKYAEIPFKTPQEIVELVLQSVVAPQPETHENVPALKSETADVSPATSTEKTIEFRFPSLPHVPVTFTYGSRVVQAEIPAFPPRETSQLLEQLSTEIDKINRELVQMPAVVEHLAVEHALQILHVPQQEISGEESVGKLISDAGIFPREEKITPHISDGQNPVALKIPFKNRAANNTVAVTEVGSFKNVGVKLKKDENQEIIGGDAPGDLLKNEKNAGETAVVREQISFKNDGAGILQKSMKNENTESKIPVLQSSMTESFSFENDILRNENSPEFYALNNAFLQAKNRIYSPENSNRRVLEGPIISMEVSLLNTEVAPSGAVPADTVQKPVIKNVYNASPIIGADAVKSPFVIATTAKPVVNSDPSLEGLKAGLTHEVFKNELTERFVNGDAERMDNDAITIIPGEKSERFVNKNVVIPAEKNLRLQEVHHEIVQGMEQSAESKKPLVVMQTSVRTEADLKPNFNEKISGNFSPETQHEIPLQGSPAVPVKSGFKSDRIEKAPESFNPDVQAKKVLTIGENAHAETNLKPVLDERVVGDFSPEVSAEKVLKRGKTVRMETDLKPDSSENTAGHSNTNVHAEKGFKIVEPVHAETNLKPVLDERVAGDFSPEVPAEKVLKSGKTVRMETDLKPDSSENTAGHSDTNVHAEKGFKIVEPVRINNLAHSGVQTAKELVILNEEEVKKSPTQPVEGKNVSEVKKAAIHPVEDENEAPPSKKLLVAKPAVKNNGTHENTTRQQPGQPEIVYESHPLADKEVKPAFARITELPFEKTVISKEHNNEKIPAENSAQQLLKSEMPQIRQEKLQHAVREISSQSAAQPQMDKTFAPEIEGRNEITVPGIFPPAAAKMIETPIQQANLLRNTVIEAQQAIQNTVNSAPTFAQRIAPARNERFKNAEQPFRETGPDFPKEISLGAAVNNRAGGFEQQMTDERENSSTYSFKNDIKEETSRSDMAENEQSVSANFSQVLKTGVENSPVSEKPLQQAAPAPVFGMQAAPHNVHEKMPAQSEPLRVPARSFATIAAPRIHSLGRAEGGTMRLVLMPEALGQVKLEVIVSEKNHAQVSMQVENAEAKKQIESQLSILKDQLSQSGMVIDKINVETKSDLKNLSNSGEFQQQSQARQEERESRQKFVDSFKYLKETAKEVVSEAALKQFVAQYI